MSLLALRVPAKADAIERQGRGLVEWNGTRLREVGKLRAPALVLAGRDDILTPPVFSRRLTAIIPNAKLRVLPGGHAFFIEEAQRFNRAVLGFLAGVKK